MAADRFVVDTRKLIGRGSFARVYAGHDEVQPFRYPMHVLLLIEEPPDRRQSRGKIKSATIASQGPSQRDPDFTHLTTTSAHHPAPWCS